MVLSQSDLYSAFDSPAEEIIEFLMWLAGNASLPPTLHVADVGSGPGRLFAPLVRGGWTITAYEPDPEYAGAAAALAASLGRSVVVKRGGFEDIGETGAFDMVLGINSSFAHLLTPAQRGAGLRCVRRALRPQGLLVLDLPNFTWILEHYRPPVPQERSLGGAQVRLEREHRIDRPGRMFTTIDHYQITGIGSGPQVATKTHVYSIISLDELLAQLSAAGFEGIRDFSSFGSRVSQPTPGARLLLVGTAGAA